MVDLEYTLISTGPLISTEDELLPGLPNALVFCNVLPRIPWYARPIMRAVSRPWKKALDSPPHPASTRTDTSCSNSCNGSGLLLIHQSTDRQYYTRTTPRVLSFFDETTRRWRRLPPLLVPQGCGLAATQGKVFVIGGYGGGLDSSSSSTVDVIQAGGRLSARADVFMLDLRRGDWQWKKCKSMKHARYDFHCRAVGSKIYVVGGRRASVSDMSTASMAESDEAEPEVYDIEEGQWEALPRVVDGERQLAWSGLCRYTRLAAIGGSDCVVVRGYWGTQAGSWARFCSRYDPKERRWIDIMRSYGDRVSGCSADIMAASRWVGAYNCSDVGDGHYDLIDGVLLEYQARTRRWQAMVGSRVYESVQVHLELDEAYDDHFDNDEGDYHYNNGEDHLDLNDDDDDGGDDERDHFDLSDDGDNDDDDHCDLDDHYDNDEDHFDLNDDDDTWSLLMHTTSNEKIPTQNSPSPLLEVKPTRATHLKGHGAGYRLMLAISTCAHDLVSSPNHNLVYVTLCKGDTRFLSLWRGQIDHISSQVAWSKINLPGSLYLCSGMCALEI